MQDKRESISQFLKNIDKNWPQLKNTTNPEIIKIHRLNEYLQTELVQLLSQYKLLQADLSVISALRRSGEPYCLTPTELTNCMLFSSGGLTKVLNRVTDMGLVERLDNPQDKRSKLVKLTNTGLQLVEQIMPEIQVLENKRQLLNQDEKQTLNCLLDKLLSHWE